MASPPGRRVRGGDNGGGGDPRLEEEEAGPPLYAKGLEVAWSETSWKTRPWPL